MHGTVGGMSSRIRTVLGAAVAFVVALMGLGLAVGPASAAPGDALSFRIDGSTQFLAQTGTTETRVFNLVNEGTESLIFASPPVLAAPLHLDSSTGMSGEIVLPGASATFTVTFSAGAAGTVSNQTVNLYATDLTETVTINRMPTLTTTSTLTPPLHYALDTSLLSYGPVPVGTSGTRQFTITNDGLLALNFCVVDIEFFDNVGTPLPDFSVTGASFGEPCGTITAGDSATVDVKYEPSTKILPFGGIVRVAAHYVSGDIISGPIIESGPVAAAAVDPAPQPTPSATPAAAKPAGAAAAASAAGAGSPQLAHTGAEPAFAIGFGTLTLALGGVALSIALGARRKARRG